jgi:hypothetical protein
MIKGAHVLGDVESNSFWEDHDDPFHPADTNGARDDVKATAWQQQQQQEQEQFNIPSKPLKEGEDNIFMAVR